MATIDYTAITAKLTAAAAADDWATWSSLLLQCFQAFETEAKAKWLVGSAPGTVTGTAPPPAGILTLCKLTGGTIA